MHIFVIMKQITITIPESTYINALNRAASVNIDVTHFCSNILIEGLSLSSTLPDILSTSEFPSAEVQNFKKVNQIVSTVPDTLRQVFAICEEVLGGRKDFRTAVKNVAKRFGVNESTVRDKCTRRISIRGIRMVNTDDFRDLLSNRNELIVHLNLKFPKFRNLIENTLSQYQESANDALLELIESIVEEPADPLTQEKFLKIVIKVLQQVGGRAPKPKVEDAIAELYRDEFKHPWYQEFVGSQLDKGYPGIPRWKKNVQWARNHAREAGLIKPPEESGRGIWELTGAGMQFRVDRT